MDHRPRRRRTVALTLAVAVVLSACGVTARDDAGPTDVLGGMEGEGGTTTTEPRSVELLPPVDLPVKGSHGGRLNTVATTAVADLEAFWRVEYPKLYGDEYRPLEGGLFAYDSSTDPSAVPCPGPSIDLMLKNAYYCPGADAVAWDQENLLPFLDEEFGEFTVAVVLGHEWGHVIQGRAGRFRPSVYTELQADCFAGAWVAHVHRADRAHFLVDTAVLDRSLGGILYLKDAPGLTADDPNAHGSGFDRVGAFQDGFQNGAEACKGYLDGEIRPYQFPYTTETDLQNEGNLPLDDGVNADGEEYEGIKTQAVRSLEAYLAVTFPDLSGGEDWVPLEVPKEFPESDPPTCNDSVIDAYRLFLCQPERWVGYSTDVAEEAYRYGDFAVATLLGSQYGLAVQDQLGDVPEDVVVLTLRGDCYAGSWAGAMVPGEDGRGDERFELVLSPGDLDEAVAVLLGIRSESDRLRQGPAFDRVSAFRTGVLQGPEACATLGAS